MKGRISRTSISSLGSFEMTCLPVVRILGFVLCCTFVEPLHITNLTALANCEDESLNPLAYFIEVRPEIDPDTGICIAMHAVYNWTKLATGPRLLQIDLYKCRKDLESQGPCLDNPTHYEELLDCKRLVEDSSGPWHMYTSSMEGSKCGEEIGVFKMDYSILKIDHLVNYLDIDDDQYRRFRIRTHFVDLDSRDVVACVYFDFDLLKVIT